MYGIPSKNALGTRRNRWTSKHSASADALARGHLETTKRIEDTPIFSTVDDDSFTVVDDTDGTRTAHTADMLANILKQQAAFIKRLEELEDAVARLSTHVEKLSAVSHSSAKVAPASAQIPSFIGSLSEDIPAVSDNNPTFTPYFIKDSYAGRDNATTLVDKRLTMTVEILRYYPESPIIYPFGTVTSLPRFSDLTINCSITDIDNKISGTIYGTFKREANGVYTMRLEDLYIDGESTTLDKCPYPIILKCDTTLESEQ